MNLYDLNVKTIDGLEQTLSAYRGLVLLVINVASQCGFTPQYAGLEKLYAQYKDRGFRVLGFPCDQFGHQEPGDEREIKEFCSIKFNVSFPMFAKIHVNGADAHPLYQYLKAERAGFLGTEAIKWNFTKFLIDREGNVVKRFAPTTAPDKIADDVEQLLTDS